MTETSFRRKIADAVAQMKTSVFEKALAAKPWENYDNPRLSAIVYHVYQDEKRWRESSKRLKKAKWGKYDRA